MHGPHPLTRVTKRLSLNSSGHHEFLSEDNWLSAAGGHLCERWGSPFPTSHMVEGGTQRGHHHSRVLLRIRHRSAGGTAVTRAHPRRMCKQKCQFTGHGGGWEAGVPSTYHCSLGFHGDQLQSYGPQRWLIYRILGQAVRVGKGSRDGVNESL